MARPRLDAPVPELHLAPVVSRIRELMGTTIGTKERLILLSIDEMLTSGPSDFNARIVCERLGVKQSMIPYHFESRDGLVAEATIWAYRLWANHSVAVVRRTKSDAEKRLRAYLEAECEIGKELRSVTVLIQYPMLSASVQAILNERYGDEMRRELEFHLAVITDLIIEIRGGKTASLNYDSTNYPGTGDAIKHASEFLAATSISWASHGIAMWASGHHMPSATFWNLDLEKISTQFAIANHIDEMVATARGR